MDEFEDFDISENDIEDAINPGRRARKLTKEDQIYGIWAETEERPQKQRKANFRPNTRIKVRNSRSNEKEEDFGSWEKHTTGFGSKMLEKMGFKQGMGLGKHGSGIVEPIKATPRQGRAALGAYGFEKSDIIPETQIVEPKPVKTAVSEEKVSASWKKTRPTHSYVKKTFDDLIKEAQNATTYESIKVVDMTSSEAKISYGYDTIMTKRDDIQTKNFQLPELTHNIKLIVDMTEKSLLSQLKRVQIKKEVNSSFTTEKISIVDSIKNIKNEIDDLDRFLQNIENLNIALEYTDNCFEKIEIFIDAFELIYTEKFMEFGVEGLVGGIFYPLLIDALDSWDLFNEPDKLVSCFSKLKSILYSSQQDTSSINNTFNSSELYSRICIDLWIPRFSRELSGYDMKDYPNVLLFLKIWHNLISPYIWNEVLKCVLNCLLLKIEGLDLSHKENYPHTWVLEYKDLVSDDIQVIYKAVFKKFIKYFQSWNPMYTDCIEMIKPWKDVLKPDQMHLFLSRSLVPKFIDHMDRKLVINPKNQDIEPLMCILQWSDVVDHQTLANVITRGFSMKWLKVLHLWLNSSPNLPDVKKWYSGWKTLLSRFINYPSVKGIFTQALMMIEQCMNKQTISSPTEYEFSIHKPEQAKKPQRVSITFKELVENAATEHCIIFTPTLKKRPDGKTIYQFGENFIYIDRDVIFLENKSVDQRWRPISLADLINLSITS